MRNIARALVLDSLAEIRRRALHWRSSLVSFLGSVPHRLSSRAESRRAHAGTIVDLFASIMCQVEGLGIDKMETTMDILRRDFPNVEHIWLAERFQRAYDARYPLSATLTLAAARRTEGERTALAMEIFAMLHRVGGDLTHPTLFAEVTAGLNLPGADTFIEKLFRTAGAEAPQPIESLCFSSSLGFDNVMLPPEDAGAAFRVLRCVNLLLVVNDADVPISVRGQKLGKGAILPLSAGQSISLENSVFSYRNIVALLQARYTGARYVNYMQWENDRLTLTRQRSRNSIARVHFGLHTEIDVLRRDADFVLDGAVLREGDSVCTSYFTPFSVQGQGPFIFADFMDADTTGHSYQLDPGNRKVIVTNLPYINQPGALMLTPGLAPAVVFEVSYTRSRNTGTLRVLEGSNHTLMVGDVPVKGEAELKDGDLIGLSPVQYLRCRFEAGVLEEESSTITQLRVRGLTRDFVRAGRVVDNIVFSLNRGEMACILGPSGSGKSTILSMLAGHLPPSFGSIRYNGRRLTPEAEDLRRHIAFIPREDILDEAMTVGEHIYQASIARRPLLSPSDRMRRVLAVMNFVGIGHLANRNVGRAGERTISDGERTRLNLGLDLTGTAEVFLIDEPISGLSSVDSERVIETLEKMSHGRMILCTLHRPAQTLLNRFHKVMVLDAHGRMAFWGTPQEMGAYFRQAAKELHLPIAPEAEAAGGADYVFEVLAAPYRRLTTLRQENPYLWQERFEHYTAYSGNAEKKAPSTTIGQTESGSVSGNSGKPERSAEQLHQTMPHRVLWRMLLQELRRHLREQINRVSRLLHRNESDPDETEPLFTPAPFNAEEEDTDEKLPGYADIPAMPRRTPVELWRLFRMWVARTFLARVRSRMGLYAVLLEGPVLALLIAGTLRAASDTSYNFYKALHINEYLFLSLVLAMFFGLTDAACEILRDRPLMRRESNYKLFVGGYLLAKTLVLTGIAGLQCALYLVVGNAILGIHEMFWSHFLVMLLTSFVGIALSLMVSAFARSDRTALNIVPLLLVPQILLAGALVRFEEMNEFSPRIPDGFIPAVVERPFSNLRHRVAYQDETTHDISSKPVPLIAEFCPLRYAFEMLFVIQTEDNLWDWENDRVNELREYLKEHGTEEQVRFIQRAALAFNGTAATEEEAKELLRRVRKAALTQNEKFLEDTIAMQDNKPVNNNELPVEFYFSNRKLAAIREGIKTARKDERTEERRGFFLSPRQAMPFFGFDQETDDGSVSTVKRNAIYLFIMGLLPILLAGRRLRSICRGK